MIRLRNIGFVILCLVITLLFPVFIEAQAPSTPVFMTGVILDETGEPFPDVNIYVKNPIRVTASNVEGKFTFNFPKNYTAQYLYLSAIGYKKDSIWLEEKEAQLEFSMKPDIQTMQEVVITAGKRESEYEILRNAYNRISVNYPTTPIRYDVFYRETNKTLDGQYVAVAEAMLDVFKNSYKKSNDKGQIRIEKSRKNIIPQYDSIVFLYFYGGAYAYIAKDHVFTRARVINPSYFNQFSYKKTGMTRFEGQDVYIIEFSSHKKDITGRLYINKTDYAYVKIEIKTDQTIPDDGFDRSNISEAIQYFPYQGKWYLRQIKYTEHKHIHNTGIDFDCSLEHLTVRIKQDSVKTIPFKQRLSYNDPFYEVAKDYNPNYWDGYNILQQDDTLKRVFESLHSLEDINKAMTTQYDNERVEELMAEVRKNQVNNLIVVTRDATTNKKKRQMNWNQFYKKIYGGIGIHYQSVASVVGDYSFQYPDNPNVFTPATKKSQQLEYGLDIVLGLHMTNHWSLYWTGTGNPFNSKLSILNNQIGTEYRFNLKERGEPMYLGFTADVGWGRYFANLGKTTNEVGSFTAGGKTIDAERLSIRGGIKQMTVSPGISFAGKINKAIEIQLYAKYNLPVVQRRVTVVKEKDGFFLSRKSATINGDYITVNGNTDKYMTVAPFQAGIILKFR